MAWGRVGAAHGVAVRVMTRDRIVLGGGSRSWKVICAPTILRALPGVEVVEGLANEPTATSTSA